jgi:asparagine synthase (glutamine-hydrolysing)
MAFGIEARVPFLDHRLVAAALLLPDRLRIGPDGLQKLALRAAVKDYVPTPILERRDKIAFAAPEARWVSDARPWIAALGVNPILEQQGFVAAGQMAATLDIERLRPGPWTWRLLIAEFWMRSLADRLGQLPGSHAR